MLEQEHQDIAMYRSTQVSVVILNFEKCVFLGTSVEENKQILVNTRSEHEEFPILIVQSEYSTSIAKLHVNLTS